MCDCILEQCIFYTGIVKRSSAKQNGCSGNSFEANGTGSSRVTIYDRLCRASLPQEHTDAAVTSTKSAEVWSGLAEWIWALSAVATLYTEEMKHKHSGKGKSRLQFLMAAATFQRYRWYWNNARLRSTVACQQAALLGTGTCGNEAVHAELRGVFRQAYHVSVPTIRLKLLQVEHFKTFEKK